MLTFSIPAIAADKQTAYDRVMETQTIRCGYAMRPPLLVKDAATGKMSGIGYDITEEIGKRLGFKIDWAEEVGFGTIVESLKTGRIDMACGAYWPNVQRAKYITFTRPVYYETVFVYQRSDDARAFKNYEALNAPQYSFASMDGSTPALLYQRHFSKAQHKTLPELSQTSDTFEDMANGKVDFVINSDVMAVDFNKSRPNALRKVTSKPLAYYPVVMFLPAGEQQLNVMIDTALTEIELDGTLEALLKKYSLTDSLLQNPKPR